MYSVHCLKVYALRYVIKTLFICGLYIRCGLSINTKYFIKYYILVDAGYTRGRAIYGTLGYVGIHVLLLSITIVV